MASVGAALPGAAGPAGLLRSPFRTFVACVVLACVALGLAFAPSPETTVPALAVLTVAVVAQRTLTSFRGMAIMLIVVFMLVPIRLYKLPISLGFSGEPYRFLLVAIAALLLANMAADSTMRFPKLAYGRAVSVLLGVAIFSIASNASKIGSEGNSGLVGGNLVNLCVFALVFVLMRMFVRNRNDVHAVLGTLVACGAIVGVSASYERASGYNVFTHFSSYLPFLQMNAGHMSTIRAGSIRATASAQHPIALGALMAMLLPVAVFMASRAMWPRPSWRAFYALCAVAIGMGLAASASRTAIVALVIAGVVGAVLRRQVVVRRILPAVAALLLLVQFVLVPGAVMQTIEQFNPPGGIVAEQTGQAGTTASGRLGDLSTVSAEVEKRPLAGIGFGSRVFTGPHTNAFILDDEYLGRLVEQGIPGLIALLVVVATPIRRSWTGARKKLGELADLNAALTCAFAAYAVSIVTFDGFSFFQVTIVFFSLLGVSAWAVTDGTEEVESPVRSNERVLAGVAR